MRGGPLDDAESRVLVFLNEVAGGRKLLEAVRERAGRGAAVAVVAPQNQPETGVRISPEERYEAAASRVDVTLAVFEEFGIDAIGEVLDPDPLLALDDAIRAYEPQEILLSCLAESRSGLLRRDLVESARARYETPILHIPVRIEDDAVRWDVTHTLVVATQTVNSADLLSHLRSEAAERPHRYTFICPRSGDVPREEVCRRLAATLAELYRADIDATGLPLSPAPFVAVENAIEHYRIDEILISTLAGQRSKWLEDNLIERVGSITDKPVRHIECDAPVEAPAAVG
ncbi:MAG: hypothetical protein QOG09_576 [Solirubrobacterales bacterium]|nr:hypothetical protein [Solirubrobacterales bacterium]